MHIVKATLSDVDELVRISRKTFHDAFHHLNSQSNMEAYMNKAFTRERLSAELANPNSSFYLVKNDHDIMGYFKVNCGDAQTEFRDNGSMEIERIYIDAEHQGQGLGTEMINHVKVMAVEKGVRYIWLGVWEKNPDAIRFYERNGFDVFSSHEFVMGDEVQIDKLMICKI
jgi:hypothetical protein